MADGAFTFKLNQKDYENMQLIMSEWNNLEGSKEVKFYLNKGADVIMKESVRILTRKNFKHSKGSPGVKTGHLKMSARKQLTKTNGSVQVMAGHMRPFGNHSHIIDLGTNDRYTKSPYTDRLGRHYKSGLYRGSVSAKHPNTGNPFWSGPVERHGPEIQARLAIAVERTLDEIIRKNSR